MKKILMIVGLILIAGPVWGQQVVKVYPGQEVPVNTYPNAVFVDARTGQPIGQGSGYGGYQEGYGCQGYGGYQEGYGCQGCGSETNEKIFSREKWGTEGGERHFEKVPSIGGKIIDAIKTIGAFAIIYR